MHLFYMSPLANVAKAKGVTQGMLNALLDDLQAHGVCLTSYGNVLGEASLFSRRDYERVRKNGEALRLEGVRQIMGKALQLYRRSGEFNETFESRALRSLYLEGEAWLFPVPPQGAGTPPIIDAALLGHGEFVAALILLGVPALFTGGTGCAFKCAVPESILEELNLARAEFTEASRLESFLFDDECGEETEEGGH